jgi:predicted DNA-binding protein
LFAIIPQPIGVFMATTKVRRVRVGTRLSVELRARLTKYCAASGISERTIIEDALRKYLDATDDTALLLRRFDRVECRFRSS